MSIAGVVASFDEERKYYLAKEKKYESELMIKELGIIVIISFFFIVYLFIIVIIISIISTIILLTNAFPLEKERLTNEVRLSFDRGFIQGKEEEKSFSRQTIENLKINHTKALEEVEKIKIDFEKNEMKEIERLREENKKQVWIGEMREKSRGVYINSRHILFYFFSF
jgi:hypothetical protein